MSIALSLGNNLTTSGIFKPAAVNNTSCNNITTFPGVSGGGTLVLLSTQTASASASISFTTGIDSTYDEYIFKFINIHPGTDTADFTFNGSTDGGSNYNVTKTTTTYYAYHDEADTAADLGYVAGHHIQQGTGYCQIGGDAAGADNDQCFSGTMHLYAPSSTNHVKHFLVNMNTATEADYTVNEYTSGFLDTTSAVNAVDFKFTSGNIDNGIIKMYGLVKS